MKTLTVLIAVALLAGCGGDDTTATAGNDEPTIRNPSPWTQQQVMDAAGLTTEDDGLSYQTSSGCHVSVVMTDKASVDLYAEAGDTVVTNPDGTAGVKTSGDEPDCLAELERGLAKLK